MRNAQKRATKSSWKWHQTNLKNSNSSNENYATKLLNVHIVTIFCFHLRSIFFLWHSLSLYFWARKCATILSSSTKMWRKKSMASYEFHRFWFCFHFFFSFSSSSPSRPSQLCDCLLHFIVENVYGILHSFFFSLKSKYSWN